MRPASAHAHVGKSSSLAFLQLLLLSSATLFPRYMSPPSAPHRGGK